MKFIKCFFFLINELFPYTIKFRYPTVDIAQGPAKPGATTGIRYLLTPRSLLYHIRF